MTKLTSEDYNVFILAENRIRDRLYHHLDSFNKLFCEKEVDYTDLKGIITNLFRVEDTIFQEDLVTKEKNVKKIELTFYFDNIHYEKTKYVNRDGTVVDITPYICRTMNYTYSTTILARFNIFLKKTDNNDQVVLKEYKKDNIVIAIIPIAVKSDLCVLKNKTPEELKSLHEDPADPGSYFICFGKE